MGMGWNFTMRVMLIALELSIIVVNRSEALQDVRSLSDDSVVSALRRQRGAGWSLLGSRHRVSSLPQREVLLRFRPLHSQDVGRAIRPLRFHLSFHRNTSAISPSKPEVKAEGRRTTQVEKIGVSEN